MKKSGNVASKAKGLVFVDRDGNGAASNFEARVTASSEGGFLLEGDKAALKGTLMHMGGTDIFSGSANNVFYQAPTSAKVLNNLTSVVTLLKEDMTVLAIAKDAASATPAKIPPSVSYAAAERKMQSALEFKGLSLLKEDAFALLKSQQLKAGSQKQLKALSTLAMDLKLEMVFKLGLAVLQGIKLTSLDTVSAQAGMIAALSNKIANGLRIDLAETSHVSDLIIAGGLASGVFEDDNVPQSLAMDMSGLVLGFMREIDKSVVSVLDKSKAITAADVSSLLGDVSTVFYVANSAAVEIVRAWYSSTGADVLQKYTGDNLKALLAAGGLDSNVVVSNYGRDVFSMTAGRDTWVVKVDDANGSYSTALGLDRYDQLMNFSVREDKLDLPVTTVLTSGLYGGLQVGVRGVVTNIVWTEVEDVANSGITPVTFEQAVEQLLVAMGEQKATVAFHKDGDTYVVQSNGLEGIQTTDTLIKLSGVLVQDLAAILI
jgi:hypothetical protein